MANKKANTVTLLAEMKSGNSAARDELLRRYLPVIQKWASGRLPLYARDTKETQDLIQVVMIRAIKSLDNFEAKREGAFLAYLRTCVMNAIRDEIRHASKIPTLQEIKSDDKEPGPSQIETMIGKEQLRAYERALMSLPDQKKEAVILRVEFNYSYAQIAEAVEAPSANAARMIVTRALGEIAKKLPD